jgi:hypothetical protein
MGHSEKRGLRAVEIVVESALREKSRMRRRGGLSYLLAVASIVSGLSGCAEFVRPVGPGATVVEQPGDGLVFGRVAIIRDGEDQMPALPRFPKAFGWVLEQLKTGKQYVVSPLTDDGIFVLALPAGSYEVIKLMYEERVGFWEGRLPARFLVQPDGVTYLGTWEIEFTNLGPSSKVLGKVVNQFDAARDDLQHTYKLVQRPITVGLLYSAKEGHLSLLRPRSEQ